ncbi:MAG TPA: hypothetical protein VFO16_10410 [Pseudonocardiaceae bacterium]|nr:hypothetical protein [Pseudonocardiaceae bacterium]
MRLSKSALIMVADGMEIPGNLGTLIRTLDAAGADCLVLTNAHRGGRREISPVSVWIGSDMPNAPTSAMPARPPGAGLLVRIAQPMLPGERLHVHYDGWSGTVP